MVSFLNKEKVGWLDLLLTWARDLGDKTNVLKEPRVSEKQGAAYRKPTGREAKPGGAERLKAREGTQERQRPRETDWRDRERDGERGMDREQQAPGSCNSSEMPFLLAVVPTQTRREATGQDCPSIGICWAGECSS